MIKYLYALLLIVSFTCTHAQENIRFFHLTSEDGLSKNSVINIFQDSRGFMWFGTRDGLNKYDGYEFTVYREDKFEPSSICSSVIHDINEDSNGNLWIASPQGVSVFKRNSEVFENFTNDNSSTSSYNFLDVQTILTDKNNRVFIGGRGGMGLFDEKNNTFKQVFDGEIKKLFLDSHGTFWLGTTNDGIYLLDGLTFEVKKHYSNDPNNPTSAGGKSVTTFKEDKDGTFWIGYANSGIDHFVPATEKFDHYTHDRNDPESLCNNAVRVIADGSDGELWIGTYKGISRLKKNNGEIEFEQIFHRDNNSYSLSHNSIYDIYKDARGAIWIATYFGGISIFHAESQLFDYYRPEPNNKNSLSYPVVGKFADASEGKVWIATEGGGLNLFDHTTGNFENLSHDPKDPSSLPDDNIKAISQTKEGNLWLGMLTQGLVYFNPKTKKIKYYNPTNSSLTSSGIACLLLDHEGVLWAGNSDNLYNYDEGSDDLVVFHASENKKQTVNAVTCIIEAQNHNIWIGTLGQGLFLFNRQTNQLSNYNLDEGISNNWNRNLINYLYEDSNQMIWVGTLGGGLLKFNPHNESSKVYYTNDGLANNIVFGIQEDSQNHLWISTSNGLSRLDKNTKVFKSFGANSNLPIYEFNDGSCHMIKDGTLFMGGLNGFITFSPEKIKERKFDASIVLTTLKIANKLVKPDDKEGILKKAINEQPNILLDYDDRNISIGYASLNYLLSGENQYAYMLEGFDKDWNYVGSKKEATFTNLPPGSYTLRIRTYNNDGALNSPEKAILIEIRPPLWKSWWAYLIYIFIIVGALYLLAATLKYKANIEKNLELEHLEREKSEELNNFKLKFYTNISHEFRTPLTLILSPIERLISSKAGDSYLRQQHQLIYKNATRLQTLINELMDFRKIETGNLHLKVGKGNIIKFFSEIKISFDEYARERGIKYNILKDDDDIQLYYDRDQLEKVFFNLLSNAFKFTDRGGSIDLKVSRNEKGKCVNIIITDTGKGMTEEQSKHVFERFYQIETGPSQKHTGTGIGLALTFEILKLHRGTISVESKVGVGTSFTVQLPMGNRHFAPEEIIQDFKDSENISPYLEESVAFYQTTLRIWAMTRFLKVTYRKIYPKF